MTSAKVSAALADFREMGILSLSHPLVLKGSLKNSCEEAELMLHSSRNSNNNSDNDKGSCNSNSVNSYGNDNKENSPLFYLETGTGKSKEKGSSRGAPVSPVCLSGPAKAEAAAEEEEASHDGPSFDSSVSKIGRDEEEDEDDDDDDDDDNEQHEANENDENYYYKVSREKNAASTIIGILVERPIYNTNLSRNQEEDQENEVEAECEEVDEDEEDESNYSDCQNTLYNLINGGEDQDGDLSAVYGFDIDEKWEEREAVVWGIQINKR